MSDLKKISDYIRSIVPKGGRCNGCPKGDPYNIKGYSGDVYCHWQEEVVFEGRKTCGINDGTDETPSLAIAREDAKKGDL